MKITKLNLESFGKFHQKEISFQPGFNCVFGQNEAGKSTIQGFLHGIFYGFYNPYTKTKRYSPLYDRYRPWNRQEFRGSLSYDWEAQTYRIERNFLKGDESVSVIRLTDGEEITNEFPYNGVYRQVVPGEFLLQMNETMFRNTVFIQQRGVQPEENFAMEVRDNFVSIAQEFSEDLSVKTAIQRLHHQLEQVGSPTRQKTSALGLAVAKLSDLEDERLTLLTSHEEMRDWFSMKNRLEEENLQLDQAFAALENEELYSKRRLLEADQLELHETKARIHQLELEQERFEPYRDFDDSEAEAILELESQIRYLKDRLEEPEKEVVTQEPNWILWPLAPALLGIAASLVFYVLSMPFGIYGGLAVLILSVLAFAILNITGKKPFIKNRESNSRTVPVTERREYERMLARLYALCQNAECPQLQTYKKKRAGKARLKEVEHELAHMDEVFEIQWKEKQGSRLDDQLSSLPEIPSTWQNRSAESIAADCKANRQRRKENELEIEWLKGMIASKESDRSLAHVEEELEILRAKADQLHHKRKAIITAIDGLETIAGEVQELFSPELTANMSEMLAFLTNGKYPEVRIGGEFEVRLVERNQERLVPVEDVSAATLELVYFALRLSIHSLAGDSQAPLFLDEPFSQFDRARHEKALRLLAEYAKHKQVIFFTSQEYELDLMHDLKMNPHLIEL